MKTLTRSITFVFYLLSTSILQAQDATFSQWQNVPTYFNPALTGDFDGSLRIRTQYRDQWRSLFGSSAYKTGIAAVDYNFDTEKLKKFNLGAHAIVDRAGDANLTTTTYSLTSSVVQHLGNPDAAHHQIGLGFEFGLLKRTIEIEPLRFPNQGTVDSLQTVDPINTKNSKANISVGLNWKYISDSKFSFHLGSAIHHINRPNLTLIENGNAKLDMRFNLHGGMELPILNKASLVPSFLFYKQGFSNQLLFGINSKWYLKSDNSNNIQLGLFAKTTNGIEGNTVNVIVLSTNIEINSFLIGFAIDRFRTIPSNSYEFTLGCLLKNKKELD